MCPRILDCITTNVIEKVCLSLQTKIIQESKNTDSDKRQWIAICDIRSVDFYTHLSCIFRPRKMTLLYRWCHHIWEGQQKLEPQPCCVLKRDCHSPLRSKNIAMNKKNIVCYWCCTQESQGLTGWDIHAVYVKDRTLQIQICLSCSNDYDFKIHQNKHTKKHPTMGWPGRSMKGG